jgi:3-oxoadipate enol-lactonase
MHPSVPKRTLEHPDRVDALIAVAAGISGDNYKPEPDEEAMMAKADSLWQKKDFDALADMEIRVWVDGHGQPETRVDPRVREKVHRMIVESYTKNQTEGKPVMLNPPAIARLAEIKVPTLVIIGNLDQPGERAAADKLASGIGGARKVVIAGTAHLPNLEKPAEFDRIVMEFLGGL